MKEINLIVSSAQKRVNISKIQKVLLKITIVLGVIFAVASLAGLYFFWETGRKSSQNKTKISNLENEVKKLNKNESYLITIDNRLTEIENIFKEEYRRTEFFKDLTKLKVPGFGLTYFEAKPKSDNLTLSGRCADSQCLINFNSKIEELVEEKRFSRANFPGISRDQEGKYLLSIDLMK